MKSKFNSLVKAGSEDEVVSILKSLDPLRLYEICRHVAKNFGTEIEDGLAFKDEEVIIDFFEKNEKIVFAVAKPEDGYRKVLECEEHGLTYIDPIPLWRNVHTLEEKFNQKT